MSNVKNWKDFLKDVPSEVLKSELENRESESSNIFTVISFDGYDGPSYNRQPVHIIEDENGNTKKANLANLSNEHLSKLQPQLSDEEPGYDDAWEEYEDYLIKYLIGKKIKKENHWYSLIN